MFSTCCDGLTHLGEHLSFTATSRNSEGVGATNELPDEVVGASFTRALNHFVYLYLGREEDRVKFGFGEMRREGGRGGMGRERG